MLPVIPPSRAAAETGDTAERIETVIRTGVRGGGKRDALGRHEDIVGFA